MSSKNQASKKESQATTPAPAKEEQPRADSQQKLVKHRMPVLCDPAKGQLFEGFDKMEDWDEFEEMYKDQILTRFRRDTENRN